MREKWNTELKKKKKRGKFWLLTKELFTIGLESKVMKFSSPSNLHSDSKDSIWRKLISFETSQFGVATKPQDFNFIDHKHNAKGYTNDEVTKIRERWSMVTLSLLLILLLILCGFGQSKTEICTICRKMQSYKNFSVIKVNGSISDQKPQTIWNF